jgi:hypothetical protein
VTWSEGKKTFGKKILMSDIISFKRQNQSQNFMEKIGFFLNNSTKIRLYVCICYITILVLLAHVLFIHECYCNFNNKVLVNFSTKIYISL